MMIALPAYRKTFRLMLALFALAWLLQAAMAQLGFGNEGLNQRMQVGQEAGSDSTRAETPVPPEQRRGLQSDPDQELPQPGPEKFVPGSPRFLSGATLEMKQDVAVSDKEVRLKDVCRWSKSDAAAFDPVADLVLVRMGASSSRSFTVRELKQTLNDAGLNLGVIRFSGATTCTISRADTHQDPHAALQEWIDARNGGADSASDAKPAPATQPGAVVEARAGIGSQLRAQADTPMLTQADSATARPAASSTPVDPQVIAEQQHPHTLRELLVADLAQNLKLPIDAVELHFNPADDKVLNLSEPKFRFNVERLRSGNLGEVSWNVLLVSDRGTQKTTIAALARAWQEELVLQHPMVAHQPIRDEDLAARRTLVEKLPEDQPVTRQQAVGQMVSRDLRAGTLLTSRLVEAVPLVRTGQIITITAQQGAVQIRTVARAMETGTLGQTIRVRNEQTRDVFEVTCTGPQEARMGGEAKSAGSAPGVATLDRN